MYKRQFLLSKKHKHKFGNRNPKIKHDICFKLIIDATEQSKLTLLLFLYCQL